MRRAAGRYLILVLALLCTACASRRQKRETVAALAAADARVLEGCYDCLLEARRTYAVLSTSRYVPADSVARRLFETEVLLTLREKELQLDWRESMARARRVAPLVRGLDANRVLAAVDAVLPDNNGRMNDWTAPLRRERAAYVATLPQEVAFVSASALSPQVRRYVALALDCSYDARVLAPRAQPGTTLRRPVLEPDATPLVVYRTGICMSPDTNMLAAVLALVPAFHEAAYFAGIPAAFRAEEDGGDRAFRHFARAYARFPTAPGVTYMSGWLAMHVGDCTAAMRWFRETVATDSTHEFALLQGTICQSRLHADSAAIAWADRLIALNASSTQQGYYWRAVSRFRLKDVAGARADVDSAKALEREPNALTLAGIIEHEQGELALAESDLREARDAPRGETNCTATWTLALVIGRAQRPAEAADMFEHAMWCYEVRIAGVRVLVQRLRENPPRNAAYLARRLDALAADSLDLRSRYHASAFNAAGHRANAGRIERAMELLAIAARDPKLAEPVAKLREAIAAVR